MTQIESISALIELQAARTPRQLALAGVDGSAITYANLLAQVQLTAAALATHGISRSDRVAIVQPDNPELVIAFLGVATVAACAPLNPAYSLDDFLFYLGDLRARALITGEPASHPAVRAAEALKIPVLPVTRSEPGSPLLAPAPSHPLNSNPLQSPKAQPQDVALVLHTSGTTSKPKQVPLTHHNLVHSAHNIAVALELTPRDLCLNIMPLFHVHGLIGALTSSLVSGASIVCTGGFSASKFFGWMQAFKPTWFTAVPTMHQALLAQMADDAVLPATKTLRFIRSCSSALAPKLMADLERTFGVPVVEAYGMTEASHQMSCNPLPPRTRKPGSVGLAVGSQIAIMDDLGNLLPADAMGEVVVRGHNVTRGYEANPAANEKAFTNGWFRTGDQGRLDADGYLFLTGRIKEIINRGGEKISPREIDEALLEHPAVAQAAAFACPHSTLGEDVAAVVALKSGMTATERDLREFAFARLAPFKVPSLIVIADQIPKGPTGKVQRVSLARQLAARLQPSYVAPTDQTESLLIDTWSEVLELDKIGLLDNFFTLGGDSLRATRATLRINKLFNLEFPVSTLFRHPSVKELAEHIRRQKKGEARAVLAVASRELRPITNPRRAAFVAPISPAPDNSTQAPLSFVQERMWFLTQLEPEAPTYNNSRLCLRLDGPLDSKILEEAFNEVLRRHEILRSRFPSISGAPVQVVTPWEHRPLVCHDFSLLATQQKESQLLALAKAIVLQPYDLSEGPLVRMALARLSPLEHILILGFHHIVFDVWSKQVLHQELRELYQAFARNQAPALPELPIQYCDFALWQRTQPPSVHEADLTYWRGVLDADLPVLNLPIAARRQDLPRYRGGRYETLLPKACVTEYEAAAKTEGATLFMLLLAGYAVLLHRYTNEHDFIIGCPIAGRLKLEVEPLIGCFVNTLPIRIRVKPGQTFRELLRSVRSTVLEAFDHQALPFEKLVESLNPARVMNRTPIAQTLLNLRNIPPAAPRWNDLEVSPWDFDDGIAQFDLALEFDEVPQGLRFLLRYDSDLFSTEAINRFVGNYLNLLKSLPATPDEPLSLAPILTDSERHTLLIDWNNTAVDYPGDQCIHHLFEAQAYRTPESVAIVCQDQCLTYGQLEFRANHIARALQALGVGPDSAVGICLHRTPDILAAVLGVLKAGAAYLPLDPSYPAERLAFILEDAQVCFVLTEETIHLPPGPAKPVLLSRLMAPTAAIYGDSRPPNSAVPTNLAYLIYTSGSTGTPKGVAIEHRNVVSFLHWARDAFTREELSGVVAATSICFDLSVFEMFAPLSWGGTVILLNNILDLPATNSPVPIQLINTVPSAMTELLRIGGLPSTHPTINLAGEPLSQSLVASLYQAGARRVYDLYGPTETTVYSTCALRHAEGPATIGRPLANTRVYVLDAHRQLLPVGVPGELYIGGHCVARGYWRRPDLTAERFIPDPFSPQSNARLYRTGDRCRWLPGGTLKFLGRSDHQVKIRGFRVELGEIESALRQCPGVAEAVVLAREHTPGDNRLIAYLQSSSNEQVLDPAQIREGLKKKLPEYMLPPAFITLLALPLTPNGKIDRNALADTDPHLVAAGNHQYIAPQNRIEQTLASIWADLLHIQPIGIRDNFFDLGGHSLLLTRVAARVQELLGCRLPIATFFQAPTIEALAPVIAAAQGTPRSVALVPVQTAGTKTPLYFVHGWGGDVPGFLPDLAALFPPDQPIYGLQALRDHRGAYTHRCVEDMAAHYVRELRQLQPRGPYYLVGHSIGGWIAYEMAVQLHQLGSSVPILALLDTRLNSSVPMSPYLRGLFAYLPARLAIHWRQFWALEPTARREYVLGRARNFNLLLFRTNHKPSCAKVSGTAERVGDDFVSQLVCAYRPHPYPGPAQFFAVDEASIARTIAVWRRLALGGVSVHQVPGEHLTMVLDKDHLRDLAAVLQRALATGPANQSRSSSHPGRSRP